MSTVTNLMSVANNAPQSASATSSLDTTSKAATRTASSSNDSSPKDKSFSNVMDTVNDSEDDADKAANPAADDTKDKAKAADPKQKATDRPEQTSPDKTPAETKKTGPDDDKDKKPIAAPVAMGMPFALFAALQSAGNPVAQTQEVESALSNPAGQNPVSVLVPQHLDALLPQNSAKTGQAVQNQQLMAMLSSNTVGTNTSAISSTQPAGAMQTQVNAQTMEQVQGLVAKSAGMSAAIPADLQDKKTAATQVVGANTGTAAASAILTGMTVHGSVNAAEDPSADKASNGTADIGKLLPGVSLTVENKTQQNQSGLMQQHTNSGMGDSHQQPVLQETMQLPEEAQFDVAPVKADASKTTPDVTQWQPGITQLQQDTPVVAAGTQATANKAAPDYDVPRQIVEQARLVKLADDTQMVIKLKPEHLGELTLKVSVSASGAVNASFHTDNAQVRNIIENSMVQLRQELQTQGLKVDHVGVYAGLGEGSLMDSHQQSANYQSQSTAARSQKIDMETFEEDADMTSLTAHTALAGANAAAGDGVDYRI